MPLQRNSPPLPLILAETVAAAICLFTIPVAFDWLSKALHGGGGGGKAAAMVFTSLLGIALLVHVYTLMRGRSAAPTGNPDQNTGSRRM